MEGEMRRMRIKELKRKKKGGGGWRYVWCENKWKGKAKRGGGRREAERVIMRLHKMRLKQDRKKRRRTERGEEASWRKSRWRRSFSVFHFNLYVCGFPSETNVHCLLIVHWFMYDHHLNINTLSIQWSADVCLPARNCVCAVKWKLGKVSLDEWGCSTQESANLPGYIRLY